MHSSGALGAIQQKSLADEVTGKVREAIIRGDLQPGEQLSEPALAAQMGVSRSPVREALHRLQAEGLVSSEPNRSTYVWQPTDADVNEIMSLRVAIESLASEWAMHRLVEADYARLQEIIDQQEQAFAAGDRYATLLHDKRFHEYIFEKAGHRRLTELWRRLMSQWQTLIYRRLQYTWPRNQIDHALILEALRKKDLEQVIELHRTINLRVATQIREVLRLSQSV